MAVWLSLGGVVPISVLLKIVVVIVVPISVSVSSFVCSSCRPDSGELLAFIVKGRLNVFLWFSNNWFVRSVRCWLGLGLDWLLPFSRITAVVSTSFFCLFDRLILLCERLKRGCWYFFKPTHPRCEPRRFLQVGWFWLGNCYLFRGHVWFRCRWWGIHNWSWSFLHWFFNFNNLCGRSISWYLLDNSFDDLNFLLMTIITEIRVSNLMFMILVSANMCMNEVSMSMENPFFVFMMDYLGFWSWSMVDRLWSWNWC